MDLRQIFLPIAMNLGILPGYAKFDEFIEKIQPDFNQDSIWTDLMPAEQAALILQFSLLTELRVYEVKAAIDIAVELNDNR